MRREPTYLGKILLDFAEIPPRREEIFHVNTRGIEFSLISFALFFRC